MEALFSYRLLHEDQDLLCHFSSSPLISHQCRCITSRFSTKPWRFQSDLDHSIPCHRGSALVISHLCLRNQICSMPLRSHSMRHRSLPFLCFSAPLHARPLLHIANHSSPSLCGSQRTNALPQLCSSDLSSALAVHCRTIHALPPHIGSYRCLRVTFMRYASACRG